MSSAEWDQSIQPFGSTAPFLNHSPREIPPHFLDQAVNEPSLGDLYDWIKSERQPDQTSRPVSRFRSLLRAIGGLTKSRRTLKEWVAWEKQLQGEARRAIELGENRRDNAVQLGRSVLLLTSIITDPERKFLTVLELDKLFSNLDRKLERTETLSQLISGFQILRQKTPESKQSEIDKGILDFLDKLTNCLWSSGRHEEALERAFQWLALANTSLGREAAREPRYWVAYSLFNLGKHELAKEALENNGFDLFSWMEFGDEHDTGMVFPEERTIFDARTWREGRLYGRILHATGEFQKAIQLFSRLAENVPQSVGTLESAFALSELGFVLGDIGHHDAAIDNIRNAAAIAEKNGNVEAAEYWRYTSDYFIRLSELDLYATGKT